MRYSPRMNHRKENESNIGKFRLDENMKIKEVCEKAEMNIGMFCSLQNGTISPVYLVGKKTGIIKPCVERLMLVLNCTLAEAFPRYFCDIKREGLTDLQETEILISEASREGVFESVCKSLMKNDISRVLKTLTPREEAVIRFRFFEDMTLEKISLLFSRSRDRIRQIEAKAIRKLRHPREDRYILKEYWKEVI
jgi:RNA polymerase sigma factor (sigma-70 family)